MADPVTWGAIGLGTSAAGGVMGAFGASAAGKSKAAMYNYQAGLAQMRSKIALQNRDYSLQTGEDVAARFGIKARQEIGSLRARQGASGVDVGSGSSVKVRESQKTITDLDMATIRNNAARRAYGYSVEAATEDAQSGLYKYAATSAKKAGDLDVMSSLISGASSVSSKWLQGQQAGLWGATA